MGVKWHSGEQMTAVHGTVSAVCTARHCHVRNSVVSQNKWWFFL